MELEEIRLVTEFASLAPSVHNTQPWRFVLEGHTLQVRADASRGLPYLDPNARQLHISCGLAIEYARLAIRSLGYACTVRLAPSSSEPTLLATLTIGHRQPSDPEERRLIDAGARRYTDRGPYEDRPVPDAVVQRLREVAEERGCWLRVLTRPGERLIAVHLLTEAEEIEAKDPAYRDELARWRREGTAPDGVPVQATEWNDPDRVTDVPLRDFGGDARHPHPGPGTPPAVEKDTLLLVGSESDDRFSWLRTGRALAFLWLVLTENGLTSQPLGPVTDVAPIRLRLQRELGLIGHPQMMLRIGYGHGQPATQRRSSEDVLKVATLT